MGSVDLLFVKIFVTVVLTAFFNCGLSICWHKWGFFEKYSIHRKNWMPPPCDFCAFFWLAVIELHIIYFRFFTFDPFGYGALWLVALSMAAMSRFACQGPANG